MLRVPLDELCLQIKLLDLGDVAEFLGKAIEPPKEEAVAEAIKGLQELQALDLREYLTPLGYHVSQDADGPFFPFRPT
jgi:HrpA-like RNA helicase